MKNRDLTLLPLEADDKGVRVVIETPMRGRNKYDYNSKGGYFELREVLPRGSEFPFDFGFFPSTLGEDGDPTDALVVSDHGLDVGVVLTARVIGAIEFEDTKDGKSVRNDRLVAVPNCSVLYEKVKTLGDLPPPLIEQIESFFERDAFFKGKEREFLGRCEAKEGRKLLAEGKARFAKMRR